MSEKKWNYNWVINKIKNIVKKTKKIAPSNSPQQSATAATATATATPTIIKKSPDDNGKQLPNDKITKFINSIYDKIHSITITVSDNRHDLLKNILEAILNICIDKFKKKGIFTDELPEGGIIINNSNPFELYNRAKITLPDI